MNTLETSRTLLDCQSEGKLSQSDALGYAVSLAQELGRLHAAGRTHGGLSPAVIVVNESGVELLPAVSDGEITPYTAPEVLTGAPSDVLSDIFSFGAVVYEMLAGRRAFDGDSAEAIAHAIAETQPPSCGGPALDRLIQTCLAKDPGARFQRVEKILMQLKLASIAARCGQLPAMTRWELADAHLEGEVRGVQTFQQQQASAIESIRTDMKRTEGLLEWVVEILEVLQSNVLDQPRPTVINGANSAQRAGVGPS
jgi:serine/threonine protein kinase